MNDLAGMYRAFLLGIDKTKTVVVNIPKWNEFVRIVILDWLNEKIGQSAFPGISNPDLESFHVDTDGGGYLPIKVNDNTGADAYLFKIPYIDVVNSSSGITGIDHQGNNVPNVQYPEYYEGIGVQFKIQYQGNPLYSDGDISSWLPARLIKPRHRGWVIENPYEQPLDNRLYFEVVGRNIRVATGRASGKSLSKGYAMRLEYYRKPNDVGLNVNGDVVTDIDITVKSRKEIVDMAVRIYLEQKKNPRYESYLQEMIIKQSKNI